MSRHTVDILIAALLCVLVVTLLSGCGALPGKEERLADKCYRAKGKVLVEYDNGEVARVVCE